MTKLPLCVLTCLCLGCGPGSQRMVVGDGRQFLPGAPVSSEPSWEQDDLDTDAERTQALEEEFVRRLEDSHASGGFLVVIKDGEVLLRQGFGRVAPGDDPVKDETLFMVASVSKVFLGLSALSLAAQGALELDAPLDGYVSGAHPDITLRLALSHRAGVPDSTSCADGLETPTDWAEVHARDELWSPPGALFNYSNGGFALAGAALEAVMGRRLPDIVDETVFAPAGASSATYRRSGGDAPRAVGQHPNDRAPEDLGCGLIEAAGGAWLSARDMSALLLSLLGETAAFSPSVLEELTDAQTSITAGGRAEYGHGVVLEHYGEELVAYHLGGLPWFGAGMLFVPGRRFAVGFAVNAGNFMPFLHPAVALYLGDEMKRVEREPALDRTSEYAGLWQDDLGLLGQMRIEGGAREINLVPLGDHAVWPLPVDGVFWPDREGNIRYFATRLGVAVKQDEAKAVD